MGDGGILNRATNARKTTDIAGAQEKVELLASEYAYDYLQEKYVNANTGVAANTGEYVASQLGTYASSHATIEGCTFSVSETTVTLSKDGKSVTGTVGESGSITWGSLADGGNEEPEEPEEPETYTGNF